MKITTRIERLKHGKPMFKTVSISTRATWNTPCKGHMRSAFGPDAVEVFKELENAWCLRKWDETRVMYTTADCSYLLCLDWSLSLYSV